ncbi:MAG: S1C family serine protease [Acidobacteriota bacterium]
MQKPTYATMGFTVVLAVLLGVLGGGVMGGFAGYYAAQSVPPAPVDASSAITANVIPSSNAPLVQAAPPVNTNVILKEDSAVIDAVRKAKPAVVTVINQMQSRRGFFANGSAPTASGSGVIVDPRGYIVTNNHVVEGEQSLQVIYFDGTKADVAVVGTDPIADIAVLKVEGKIPAAADFGDSSALETGQLAIAIGSPLGDFRGTVTLGIVSALNRRVGRQNGLIQTDAAINNGNSGGPLLNALGQVIGINTLVVRSTSEGNVAEGLGFAIPSNQVRQIVTQLITQGKVDHPYMGVNYQEVDPAVASALNLDASQGVVVTQVDPSSPAAKAGLKESDVILTLDANKIDLDHPLSGILLDHKVGDTVTLTIMRSNQQMQIRVTLGTHPSS